jgi:ketosteroid isomerase-like protein
MTQVPLAEIPQVLVPAFAAGDGAAEAKVQERTNVERLGQMVEVISRGRFDELRERLAADVTYEMAAPPHVPWRRRTTGADQVTAAIAENFASVREQRTEPLALVSQGDTVMVMARETGRFADGGQPYEMLIAQQFTFDGEGRLTAFRSVAGEAGAY